MGIFLHFRPWISTVSTYGLMFWPQFVLLLQGIGFGLHAILHALSRIFTHAHAFSCIHMHFTHVHAFPRMFTHLKSFTHVHAFPRIIMLHWIQLLLCLPNMPCQAKLWDVFSYLIPSKNFQPQDCWKRAMWYALTQVQLSVEND